jgi:hypothetical protein
VAPDERCWFPALRWKSEQLDDGSSYQFLSLPYWLAVVQWDGVVATSQSSHDKGFGDFSALIPGGRRMVPVAARPLVGKVP